VFVAGFIGSPAMNFIRARLERANGGLNATFGRTRIPLSHRELESYAGKDVVLGIRPEHIEDAGLTGDVAAGADAPNTIEIEPQVIESMGSEKYVYFELPKSQPACLDSIEETRADGAEGAVLAEDFGGMMVGRVSAGSAARRGEAMLLAVDASRIHLFDPDTGEAIIKSSAGS
jgi:multiple sugar transport system ATP-binding protein